MPHVITKTVYNFDELDAKAKEVARSWFRENQFDYDWWEFTYSDAEVIGGILGITFDRKINHASKKVAEPCIWFSGFGSQEDGACFEGRYSYVKGASFNIRRCAPDATELHRIADELMNVQKRHSFNIEAGVKHIGNYYSPSDTEIWVTDSTTGKIACRETEKEITVLLRDFMKWIYRALEQEYGWLGSDEHVDESILANEYVFTETGVVV